MHDGMYRTFHVFISSPRGVEQERQIVRLVINNMSPVLADTLNLHLAVDTWEGIPPDTPNLREETIQDSRLNVLVERCQIFILLLHDRYGSTERGQSKSNTEREVDIILDKKARDRTVKILSYFKKISITGKPTDQQSQALALRESLEQRGLFIKEFDDANDFKDKIINDLYHTVFSIATSSYKKRCLSKFFNLGNVRHHDGKLYEANLAIIHSPVRREHLDGGKDKGYWHKRFMPKLYFEDEKAIQKIQKLTTMLGIDCAVYTHTETPAEIQILNKVYVCVPRIPRAIAQLETQPNRRFNFAITKTKKECTLKWKNKSGEIQIQSPLAKYLEFQRDERYLQEDWNPYLSKILARDFAILARFEDKETETKDGVPIKNYYIAGVRGLGTWGAAWYLDKHFEDLVKLSTKGDVQILLEVTYKDTCIVNAIDVSDKTQNYFDSKNKTDEIEQHIANEMFGKPYRPVRART